MTSTKLAEARMMRSRPLQFALAIILGMAVATAAPASEHRRQVMQHTSDTSPSTTATLDASQRAILPIAAFAAAGDIEQLGTALEQGLDAGLTISDAREVLLQLYAYAGFPRSLNALGELMRVRDARAARGIEDAEGVAPTGPIPTGDALLAAGTANQTRLVGQPVSGPLFEFAPTANIYLRTHLFGDIFERDNLDWQSRELATVGMLAALEGVESQLQSHMAMSMQTGLSEAQLRQAIEVIASQVNAAAGERARHALEQHLQPAQGD